MRLLPAGDQEGSSEKVVVLVATEDQATIDILAAMNELGSNKPRGLSQEDWQAAMHVAREFRFVWTRNERRSLRLSIPQGIRLGLLSAAEENRVSLVNLILLSRASGFVGTFSSGYSKRVFELQAAHQQDPESPTPNANTIACPAVRCI